MIVIDCPYCGPRNSTEFRHAGEAGHKRNITTTDPAQWRYYLYVHDNPMGWTRETWFHGSGCRRFISAERHTVTNEFRWIAPYGQGPADSTHADNKESGA